MQGEVDTQGAHARRVTAPRRLRQVDKQAAHDGGLSDDVADRIEIENGETLRLMYARYPSRRRRAGVTCSNVGNLMYARYPVLNPQP